MTNLKLCPFCDSSRLEQVICIDCKARGPLIESLERRLGRELTPQYEGSGFVAWNTRGIVAAIIGLVLSACGGAVAEDPLDRFVAAVCACGSGWQGCEANVRSEATGADPMCLGRWADAYERSCTGLPAPDCRLEDR